MFEKLESIEEKYDKLNKKLYDPNIVSNQDEYRKIMKEHKQLTPIIEKYHEYKNAKTALNEAKQLLSEGGIDAEFKEMLDEEIRNSTKKIEQSSEELKILLLPK